MNLSDSPGRGLIFSAGLTWSYTPVWSAMHNYARSYPDTLVLKSGTHVACTTFERAPDVGERIEYTRFEVPLALKSYLSDNIYVKAGVGIGLSSATTYVHFELSRTGGGWVTNLTNQERVYLDQAHEMDNPEYGYFRNVSYQFRKERFTSRVYLNLQLAAGGEVRYRFFGIGVEPNITFGMNPMAGKSSANDYTLGDPESYHSVMESIRKPWLDFSFGIRVVVSCFL
jgi:hypothetical protein